MKNPQSSKSPALDKSSRSMISRSTRLTKKNLQDQYQQYPHHYFNRDKLSYKILQRCLSKIQEEKNNVYLNNVEKIVKGLVGRNKLMQEKLVKLREEAEKENRRICTFKPAKTSLQRYKIGSNIIRRNEVWLRQKKRKQLQRKQQLIFQNLKQCTFNPNLPSRKTSKYLSDIKSRYHLISTQSYAMISTSRHHQRCCDGGGDGGGLGASSERNFRKDYSKDEYQVLRKNLILRLRNQVG